ncbi:MAG: hypothetical protein MI810_22210 [Flavobacteriales bacterium]|nr:hypothetical protein [Flavobacteriales bacterium]
MKVYILLSACMVFLLACHKEMACNNESGDLLIRFENNSGENLKKLVVAGREIGDLNDGDATCYLAYPEFDFDGSLPDESCSAEVKSNTIEGMDNFYFCGTEKFTETSGKFDVEITKVDYEKESFLQLLLK